MQRGRTKPFLNVEQLLAAEETLIDDTDLISGEYAKERKGATALLLSACNQYDHMRWEEEAGGITGFLFPTFSLERNIHLWRWHCQQAQPPAGSLPPPLDIKL
jgi:hypothetical protein